MKKVISATIALLLTLNLSAQTTQFSQKEQDKIVKLFTKTFINNEAAMDEINELASDYFEGIGQIMEEDILAHPIVTPTLLDSLITDDVVNIVLTYTSDNQLYTINANEEWDKDMSIPLMHFFNALYYGGGIESVVKSASCTITLNTQDTIYDVEYEFVNQDGSPIINNRYIQQAPKP